MADRDKPFPGTNAAYAEMQEAIANPTRWAEEPILVVDLDGVQRIGDLRKVCSICGKTIQECDNGQ